ncbi:hypothetical protein VCHA34P126_40120 [Vibrio chagasii]|nr:hypothetical protein VCHA30O60_10311 [Vibrio chagasii]CAH6848628.1 hypothetical protein VCHA34P117_10275 [Vibrio chagasii]CAH6967291.1 hypothetical protein VCHA34P126_40120 [Vibrio chagasii]CAH6980598.1 hypothetical protein VCHA36P161_40240 [Vibrio chagasii]CAH7012894.1 hypothetical protein VCHA48P439_10105 [Vibrio chagasii]
MSSQMTHLHIHAKQTVSFTTYYAYLANYVCHRAPLLFVPMTLESDKKE